MLAWVALFLSPLPWSVLLTSLRGVYIFFLTIVLFHFPQIIVYQIKIIILSLFLVSVTIVYWKANMLRISYCDPSSGSDFCNEHYPHPSCTHVTGFPAVLMSLSTLLKAGYNHDYCVLSPLTWTPTSYSVQRCKCCILRKYLECSFGHDDSRLRVPVYTWSKEWFQALFLNIASD